MSVNIPYHWWHNLLFDHLMSYAKIWHSLKFGSETGNIGGAALFLPWVLVAFSVSLSPGPWAGTASTSSLLQKAVCPLLDLWQSYLKLILHRLQKNQVWMLDMILIVFLYTYHKFVCLLSWRESVFAKLLSRTNVDDHQFSYLHKDLSFSKGNIWALLISFVKAKNSTSCLRQVKGSTVKRTPLLWTFSFPLPQPPEEPQAPRISVSQTSPSVGITWNLVKIQIQYLWMGAWDSAFLTSSQVI